MGFLRLLGRLGRRAAPVMDEPVTRLPVNALKRTAQAADGSVLPMAEPQPFRQSFVGGSEDLMEALRMGRISWPEFLLAVSAASGTTYGANQRGVTSIETGA